MRTLSSSPRLFFPSSAAVSQSRAPTVFSTSRAISLITKSGNHSTTSSVSFPTTATATRLSSLAPPLQARAKLPLAPPRESPSFSSRSLPMTRGPPPPPPSPSSSYCYYYVPSRRSSLQQRRAFKAPSSGKHHLQTPADSSFVRIVEVGARDGLQNEKHIIPVDTKIELIDRLSKTGLQNIEAGSFVSPKWVPQMADSSKILSHFSSTTAAIQDKLQEPNNDQSGRNEEAKRQTTITYSYLVPNLRGLQSALATTQNIPEIAIFASASEGFSQKNINCSISQSLERFTPVTQLAQEQNIPIRGYVSMIISCPYDGPTDPNIVAQVTKQLLNMGCYEVSLGDTNGVGTPETVSLLLDTLINKHGINPRQLAAHFHDTYGQALVNAMVSLQFGIRVFDGSVAGLGGCPYAKGATGNVATEDLVYFLESMGFRTGVDLVKLSEVGRWISEVLGRANGSKVGPAVLAMKERELEKGQAHGEEEKR